MSLLRKLAYLAGRAFGRAFPGLSARSRRSAALSNKASPPARPARIEDPVAKLLRIEKKRISAGLVDGIHYSAYAKEVKALKRAGDLDAAAGLLLRLVDAVEREAAADQSWPIAPYYHPELASIFRSFGAFDQEARVLQRYVLMLSKRPEPIDPLVMDALAGAQSRAVAATSLAGDRHSHTKKEEK